MRKAHRWIAMSALGFFLLSLITGLLWANVRFLYWEDHYKEKVLTVLTVTAPPLGGVRIALPAAIEVSKAGTAAEAQVEQVILRSDAGKLFYDIRLRAEGKAQRVLVDAMTGARLSPISAELAEDIARQYVRGEADVTGCLRNSTLREKSAIRKTPCVCASTTPIAPTLSWIGRPARSSRTKDAGERCTSS